jgi:aspartate racemase
LRIDKRLYAQIVDHLIDALPNEGCGLIAFDYDRPVKVYPGTNILRSPRRYRMDDAEVLRAIEEIDANGWWLGAIYHSHPHSAPEPSTTDVRESNWPDALMVIVSLQHAEPEARAYRLLRGTALQVPLEVYAEWPAWRRVMRFEQRLADAWSRLTKWVRPSGVSPAPPARPVGVPVGVTSGSEQALRADNGARTALDRESTDFAAPVEAERCAVIGILGGMGPAATADLYRKIIEATPADRDQEHIPVVIHADPRVPDRTEALLHGGPNPTPWLIEGARALERMGATFIVIPCNTAHAFLARVQPHVERPILSMIDATVDTIRERYPGANVVGLLATNGTIASGVYQRALEARGLAALVPEEAVQERCVMPAIQAVKAGEVGDAPTALMVEAAEGLRERGAEVLIAGCTEIPLILRAEHVSVALVDATDALARTAVATALYLNRAARTGRQEWETSPTGWTVNAAGS